MMATQLIEVGSTIEMIYRKEGSLCKAWQSYTGDGDYRDLTIDDEVYWDDLPQDELEELASLHPPRPDLLKALDMKDQTKTSGRFVLVALWISDPPDPVPVSTYCRSCRRYIGHRMSGACQVCDECDEELY